MTTSTNSTEDRPPSDKPHSNDKQDLAAVDAAVDHMHTFLPEEPYVLTIQQDVGDRYQHHYKVQAQQWMYNTPFSSSEWEGLQYQTFEYHEPLKTMYTQRTHAELERSERIRDGRTPATGYSTPIGGVGGNTGAPKKVLSLSAWKQKKEGTPLVNGNGGSSGRGDVGGSDEGKKREALKGPVERMKAETAEVLAAAKEAEEENADGATKIDRTRKKESDSQDLKRKREAEGQRADREKSSRKSAPVLDDQPPTKKARKSPERTLDKRPRKTSPAVSPDLPPRPISPLRDSDAQDELTLPPPLTPLYNEEVPRRLSASFSDNVKHTLDEKRNLSSTDDSAPNSSSKNSHANKEDHLTPTKAVHDTYRKHVSPAPRNGYRASSNSPAVQAIQAAKTLKSTSRTRGSPVPPELSKQDEREVGRSLKQKLSPPAQRPSLVVRMKYKKQQRESIKRILKMRPRPADPPLVNGTDDKEIIDVARTRKGSLATVGDKRQSSGGKGVAQKIELAPAKKASADSKSAAPASSSSGKRKKDEEHATPQAAAKKKKPDANHTPLTPTIDRDSPAASSAQRHTKHSSISQSTPSVRRDVLNASVQKDRLSVDFQNTPSSSTPSANSAETSLGNRASSVSSASGVALREKTALQRAWEKEQSRLQSLGRELKHSAQDHAHSFSQHPKSDSHRHHQLHAALASTEAYLAFMLCFHAADMASAAASPRIAPIFKNWHTLDSFLSFVKGHCRPFPGLEVIAMYLGIASLARMVETAGLVSEKNGPSMQQLLSVQRRLLTLARDVERAGGSVDGLMELFPSVWEGRDRSVDAKSGKRPTQEEEESRKPGEYRGGYKLPVGVQTSPLTAVRVGMAMLKEWVEREGKKGEYEFKLKL